MAGAIRISAVFLFHSGSNEGYAIASLAEIILRGSFGNAGQDSSRGDFGYRARR